MKFKEKNRFVTIEDRKTPSEKGNVFSRLFTSAIFLSVLTYTAYLIGMAYYQDYMTAMHFSYQIFPKTSNDYFVYCYCALMNLFPAWFVAESNGIRIVTVIVSLCIFLGVINLVGKLISESKWMKSRQKGIGQNKKIRMAGHLFVPSFFAITFFYYTPILFSIILVVPAMIGQKMGKKVAFLEMQKYENGCNVNENSGVYCTEVMDSGKKIAVGFIIEASDKYIAVIENGRARTIPLKDKEFSAFIVHHKIEPVSVR